MLHLGSPQRVKRPGLDHGQQPQRRVQRVSVALRPSRREQALRPASGLWCQHRRPFEERGGRGQSPARLAPGRPNSPVPSRRPSSGPGRLNLEIGARLYLTARTVKYHLGKVFAKLAASFRNQLDRVLPRTGHWHCPPGGYERGSVGLTIAGMPPPHEEDHDEAES